MPFWTSFDDSPDMMRTTTPDGRDLVFLTGTAGFDFQGTGSTWLSDDALHLVGPVWTRLDGVAAMASLTASRNEHEAVDYGLAVDNCRWDTFNGRIMLVCRIVVSDVDAHIYRFAYQVTAVGQL